MLFRSDMTETKNRGKNSKKNKMKYPVLGAMIVMLFGAGSCFGGGFGLGPGGGAGDGGNGSGAAEEHQIDTPTGEMIQDLVETTEAAVTEDVTVEETLPEETEGKAVVSVSIVENDYFFQNERITLPDLIEKLKEEGTDVIVSIEEDDASLKAYKDLVNQLKEAGFSFIEDHEV